MNFQKFQFFQIKNIKTFFSTDNLKNVKANRDEKHLVIYSNFFLRLIVGGRGEVDFPLPLKYIINFYFSKNFN